MSPLPPLVVEGSLRPLFLLLAAAVSTAVVRTTPATAVSFIVVLAAAAATEENIRQEKSAHLPFGFRRSSNSWW